MSTANTVKGANGKASIRVNGLTIATAITRQRLSVRELARRTGLTFTIVYRMTRDNLYSADLPLRHLIQVADTLDLELSAILNTTPLPSEGPDVPPPNPREPDTTAAIDAERLAGVLALSRYLGSPHTVAQGLGWTLDRLETARRHLNTVLAPAGLKAAKANDHLYLTPRNGATREDRQRDAQRIEVLETRDRPITLTLARLLDDAINDRHPNTPREGEKPFLAYAVNVGYLAPDPHNKRDLGASSALRDAFPDL